MGEIAETIVECSQRVGGIITRDDLAGYSSKFDTPVKTTFMGREIHCQPTWTQAPVVLQTLNILEQVDLKSMGHNTPEYIHTVIEALKLALADREAHYGDPEFSTIPIDGLLSKEYAAERARLIDPGKAHPELPQAGDPWGFSRLTGAPSAQPAAAASSGDGAGNDSGTTHIAVLDRDGNMVCATPSGGTFAGSVFFPELGCTLSTRSEMFNFTEGHPNVLVPGKRPRTTLINYIVSEGGRPIMTIGCPGGDMQAQANVQLMLNTLVWGMNPQEAIEAPRFGTLSAPDSFYPHSYFPGRLALEPEFSSEAADSLRRLGHEVVRAAVCGMGATVARRDPDTGVLSAGGDPRRACYAIGW
jgi:gamma-glutamyltranspeptidase/glutathione hydrolase